MRLVAPPWGGRAWGAGRRCSAPSGWSRRRSRFIGRAPASTMQPRVTQASQRTQRVALLAVEAALIGHADVTKGEVVLHRVLGVQFPERGGDVGGHLPAGTDVAR